LTGVRKIQRFFNTEEESKTQFPQITVEQNCKFTAGCDNLNPTEKSEMLRILNRIEEFRKKLNFNLQIKAQKNLFRKAW
jgi:hypothetical protein